MKHQRQNYTIFIEENNPFKNEEDDNTTTRRNDNWEKMKQPN